MQLNALTRKSALAAILLLLVMLVAVAVRSRLAPIGVELADSEYRGRTLSLVVAMFVMLFAGMVEGKMLVRSGLNRGFCTLPMPIFGLLACGIFVAPATLPTAIVSLLFALAIHLFLRSLHSADERDSLFFGSMLLGSMVLLYPPSIVLFGVLLLLIFATSLSLRQVVLTIVGYLLPLLTASYVLWYRGGTLSQFWINLGEALLAPQMGHIESLPYLAIAMVVAVVAVLIWGVVYSALRPHKMFLLVRVRRALHLFIGVMVVSLLMLLLPSSTLTSLAIVAVPATILLCLVLELLPNNHSTIAYWVLLALFVAHLFVA